LLTEASFKFFKFFNTNVRKEPHISKGTYNGVSKSFQTGRLERELQMVQPSATKRRFIAIL